MSAFTHVRTQDGTVIARCLRTNVIASGRTVDEAIDRLRHLLSTAEAA